jgi:hypothetical protein
MRKFIIFLSCFTCAFLLGIGSVLFLSENAKALYCDVYAPSPYLYQSDNPCTTASGASGTWLYRCVGWLYFNGDTYECGCVQYRCVVPPKPPDEIPYQEP